MTNEKAMQRLQSFIEDCKKESDCFLIVHFSRSEDKYKGTDNLDFGDALIVVEELNNKFNFDYNILAEAFKKPAENYTPEMIHIVSYLVTLKMLILKRRKHLPEAEERRLTIMLLEAIDELHKFYKEIL